MSNPSRITASPPAPQSPPTDRRERIAVFLGAGVSKAFGYPVTGELLPALIQHLDNGELGAWGYSVADQTLLRDGLLRLFPGLHKVDPKQLPLITDVLTLLDHAHHTRAGLLHGWPTSDVDVFHALLQGLIADMVDPDGYSTPEHRVQVSRVASGLTRAATHNRIGVVTTNYDIELELSLYDRVGKEHVAERIDFGMSWRDPGASEPRIFSRPSNPWLAFYKLHGSINWLGCPLCEYIYVNVNGPIVGLAAERTRSPNNTCHCEHWPLQSVLVTPSFRRDTRNVSLSAIWRNSLDLLATADRWIIAGYSLPAEDIAIRAMFIKAYSIRQQLRTTRPLQIWIVQRGEQARPQYDLLFDGNASYHADGIETFDLDAALL